MQESDFGALVTLFRLDATPLGGPVMFFCQSAQETRGVVFGGVTYTPVDVKFEGFEVNGGGALPTPKMTVSNTDNVISDIATAYGDLLGCNVARVRTFRRYLDGQIDADPGKFMGPDIFKVEQKTSDTETMLEWELSAAIDQEGKKLPGRLVLRDVCPWRYRYLDTVTGQFVVSTTERACPYAGDAMFDRLDKATSDPTKDQCSQTLAGCQARFGRDQALPFGGFLGVARVRV